MAFRVPIVMAIDENYAAPLSATVTSLLDSLRWDVGLDLFLMAEDLTPATLNRLAGTWDGRVRLHLVPVCKEKLMRLAGAGRFVSPSAAHLRALMASSLPEHLEKIIYLDADLLVLRDVLPLWEIDMAGHTVLAVQDSYVQHLPDWCSLSGPAGDRLPYFNSGVMVIDLNAWRSSGVEACYEAALDRVRGRTRWSDQDALNACLAGRWGALAPMWNKQFALNLLPDWRCSPHDQEEFRQALHEPRIVHFCTRTKPWHSFCDHPAEDVSAYRAVLRRTGFDDAERDRPSRKRRLVERFAAPHRRLLDTVAVVARARRKVHAWRALGPRMFGLAARHPWTLFTVPAVALWRWRRVRWR